MKAQFSRRKTDSGLTRADDHEQFGVTSSTRGERRQQIIATVFSLLQRKTRWINLQVRVTQLNVRNELVIIRQFQILV
ncbi:hypothetical protein L596_015929 [Steinernema carpocapsae]|uniref:Uncharacterized protein n=1 Tax=Steinernema carpocapsae TaxID=34508 RepID=A0A4U5NHN3_STECR|nr:hypothetical protein L596_015929 [Steinernema carpocapsae]